MTTRLMRKKLRDCGADVSANGEAEAHCGNSTAAVPYLLSR